MRESDPVVLISCADLHLSHWTPLARSREDWYGVMREYLSQLRLLLAEHKAPLVIAGDIFDKWNQPPELLNFVLSQLPNCYAIPGQHDLPYHNYDDMMKSAFGTLVQTGRVLLLEPGKPRIVESTYPVRLHGFPWGYKVQPLKDPHDLLIEVAVVHDYIWHKEKKYPGAPDKKSVQGYAKKLRGYDVALFGDNHQGFLIKRMIGQNLQILNHGTFIRRKIDEIAYKPCVGLIHQSGKVSRHLLDTSRDDMREPLAGEKMGEYEVMARELLEELSNLGEAALSFNDALRRIMEDRNIPDKVRKIVLKAMETL